MKISILALFTALLLAGCAKEQVEKKHGYELVKNNGLYSVTFYDNKYNELTIYLHQTKQYTPPYPCIGWRVSGTVTMLTNPIAIPDRCVIDSIIYK